MSSNNTNYKYDVAFSFLEQDESVATQIHDLLQERLSTFIYTDRQKEIAGTDGEKTFNEVFCKQSRIVVVFYREGWGDTPWTRIEQTAIRNRAYEEGYGFVLFITMEPSPQIPQWLPKTQIWIGLKRWGVDVAAGVIEARVQETGGTPKEETTVQRAKRKERDIERMKARNAFLNSDDGVKAANKEVDNLFLELQTLCDTIATETGWTFEKHQPPSEKTLLIYSCGITLAHGWGCRWSNTLEDAYLFIRTWRGKRGFPNIWNPSEPVMLNEFIFSFDTQDTIQFGWKKSDSSERLLSSKQLAEFSMKLFVDAIHQLQTQKYE